MGRQSARLYFQGKDHKDIYFQGHYHKAVYLTDSGGNALLVWEKLDGEMNAFTPWGIAFYEGIYYVLRKELTQAVITEGGFPVSVTAVLVYTGRALTALKLRHTEYFTNGDHLRWLYFADCNEYGLEFAFGTHPETRGQTGTGAAGIYSAYRRIPDVHAHDYGTQYTNKPSRAVRCGNFGVVFDAEGNSYWCSTSALQSMSYKVTFYKRDNPYSPSDLASHMGAEWEKYAEYTLDEGCCQSDAFLTGGSRIAVCCLPYDLKYYPYAQVMQIPFYVCSVTVGGSGADITAEELGNKELVYTDPTQTYVPMRLSKAYYRSHPDMFDETMGYIMVEGTSRGLVIDYSRCMISRVLPLTGYEYLICICQFGGVHYIVSRTYIDGMYHCILYYGSVLSKDGLKKLHINTGGTDIFISLMTGSVSGVYVEGNWLHVLFSSLKGAVINMDTGDYERKDIDEISVGYV